jgi:hypothetical protein
MGHQTMKYLCKAFYGVLLALGLAAINPIPALAGGYVWDTNCNCMRPDYQYTTRRYIRGAPRVITHERFVDHTRVVPGRTRLIQENRVTVHVRPVINREVVVHRTHTIVRNVVLHRVNRINRYRNEYYNQVVDVNGGNTVREVTVYRNVRGGNCGCGYQHGYGGYGAYRSAYGGYHRGLFGDIVSARD